MTISISSKAFEEKKQKAKELKIISRFLFKKSRNHFIHVLIFLHFCLMYIALPTDRWQNIYRIDAYL